MMKYKDMNKQAYAVECKPSAQENRALRAEQETVPFEQAQTLGQSQAQDCRADEERRAAAPVRENEAAAAMEEETKSAQETAAREGRMPSEECPAGEEKARETPTEGANGEETDGEETAAQEDEEVLWQSESPVWEWVRKDVSSRGPEVEFLQKAMRSFPVEITASGDLRLPFFAENNLFLLAMDRQFPERTESGDVPVKVYLVTPEADHLTRCLGGDAIGVETTADDPAHLTFQGAGQSLEQDYQHYRSRGDGQPFVEQIYRMTTEWSHRINERLRQLPGNRPQPMVVSPAARRRSRYTECRPGHGGQPNPKCRKVVLSDRAYMQIFQETQARMRTETGGLLIGHYDRGVWYVLEASDPGWAAKFREAYHEGDDVYENHVCSVMSRIYKHPLAFLGMWHRHPGSLDTFSGTDDRTNFNYTQEVGNGCISAIVNYDPEFRITFYYAQAAGRDRRDIAYSRVAIEVGDEKIPAEIRKIATIEDVYARRRKEN